MTWLLPVSRASLVSEQGHVVGITAAIFFVLGSLVSWCGTNNSAIFAEVVPEHLRSSVFAFDRAFETAIGALAGPIVGFLSPLFGFKGTIKPGGAGVDRAALDANAKALGNAILVMMVVPWALCGIAYFGLYFTVAPDRAAASRADAVHKAAVAEAAKSVSLSTQASSISPSSSMTGDDVPLKV